jgi:hypothetical protein
MSSTPPNEVADAFVDVLQRVAPDAPLQNLLCVALTWAVYVRPGTHGAPQRKTEPAELEHAPT